MCQVLLTRIWKFARKRDSSDELLLMHLDSVDVVRGVIGEKITVTTSTNSTTVIWYGKDAHRNSVSTQNDKKILEKTILTYYWLSTSVLRCGICAWDWLAAVTTPAGEVLVKRYRKLSKPREWSSSCRTTSDPASAFYPTQISSHILLRDYQS